MRNVVVDMTAALKRLLWMCTHIYGCRHDDFEMSCIMLWSFQVSMYPCLLVHLTVVLMFYDLSLWCNTICCDMSSIFRYWSRYTPSRVTCLLPSNTSGICVFISLGVKIGIWWCTCRYQRCTVLRVIWPLPSNVSCMFRHVLRDRHV